MSFHEGFLAGRQWSAEELAELGHKHGWRDLELVVFVAVALSESAGREKAHCINYKDAEHTQMYAEDIGLLQISEWRNTPYPADGPLWNPDTNAAQARKLYEDRKWQPWHGFTSFIATNPEMAGEYIQRAVWGVANFYRKQYGIKQLPYPRKGSALRALLDKLTAKEHPAIPAFHSRTLGLRSE